MQPSGVRERAGLAEHELAGLTGCRPSTSLLGGDPGREAELVQAGGLLHDEAGAGRVGVEPVDLGLDLGLGGGRGQVHPERRDADLGTVLVLGRDVPVRTRVVAHEHRAQPGHDAALAQPRDPLGQLGLDRLEGPRCRPASVQSRGHPSTGACSSVVRRISGRRRRSARWPPEDRQSAQTVLPARSSGPFPPTRLGSTSLACARSVEEVSGAGEVHGDPAALRASIVSSSRTEPPGCTIAATPASMSTCGPSSNGKKASEAATDPRRAPRRARRRAGGSRPG